jgi:branched-chain amino acid aminotransferase
MSLQPTPITIHKSTSSGLSRIDFSTLKFGEQFADHMVLVEYHDHAWQTPEIRPYGPISVMPSMSIFHYGQGVFEGMKAFRTHDGKVNIFRPDKHYQRFKRSCERMCIPVLPEDVFMTSLTQLVALDQEWVPKDKFKSLYIRPFVVAAEEFLGLRACTRYKFMIITSPVGNYYGAEVKPVSLTTMPEYVRAVAGGLGEAKVPGNYAGALLPTQTAQEKGFAQVLWLDAFEHRYIEEVGSMNMCFIINGSLVTPPLAGTILPGVTRDSILTLARDWGIPVDERRISIDELIEHAKQGSLQEAFGMGTAAVITPVGKIHHQGTDIVINHNEFGPVAQRFYDYITGLHHGETEDTHGWNHQIA